MTKVINCSLGYVCYGLRCLSSSRILRVSSSLASLYSLMTMYLSRSSFLVRSIVSSSSPFTSVSTHAFVSLFLSTTISSIFLPSPVASYSSSSASGNCSCYSSCRSDLLFWCDCLFLFSLPERVEWSDVSPSLSRSRPKGRSLRDLVVFCHPSLSVLLSRTLLDFFPKLFTSFELHLELKRIHTSAHGRNDDQTESL